MSTRPGNDYSVVLAVLPSMRPMGALGSVGKDHRLHLCPSCQSAAFGVLDPNPKSAATSRASRPRKRGVSRSSRTLGAGCGGRFGGALTSGADADGEVVWS